MAYVNTPGLAIPGLEITRMGIASTSFTIDASGEKLAFLVTVPKTGTLKNAAFRVTTVTTSDTLKVSFQDVDAATGNPDEVVDQYRTLTPTANAWNTTGIITDTGADGGVKRSVTEGQQIFVVIEFDSYVAGNLIISALTLGWALTNTLNYPTHKTGGTWTKSTAAVPNLQLIYDDDSRAYCHGTVAASSWNNASINTGSATDEVALLFQVPFTCKISGAVIKCEADGPLDIVLYDSDGTTVLDSFSLDPDVRAHAGTSLYFVKFSDIVLTANTSYRIAIKPTSATNVGYEYWDVAAVADWDSWFGGQTWHLSTRADAGSWTQTTTRRPMIGLLISAVETGGSSTAYVIGS